MIRYSLRCQRGHGFDGWFRSSSDYDVQASRSLLSCPVCGSEEVSKALMAPSIAARAAPEPGAGEPAAPMTSPEAAASGEVALMADADGRMRELLRDLKRHVRANTEDVGDRFPALARQMHAEEIERRSIRGRATAEEAAALVEEGVAIHPLPRFPDDVN